MAQSLINPSSSANASAACRDFSTVWPCTPRASTSTAQGAEGSTGLRTLVRLTESSTKRRDMNS